ncbi:MAG: 3-demethylubiquinone-9 3-O-methyltransferase [Deltaproteobacteria bacterium]|nr:3-demethylubiquinone-9 3-O-methyltransferase [Deltaproteobacteria bacterium]
MNSDWYGKLGAEWRDKDAALSSLHAAHPITLRYFMDAMGGDIKDKRILDAGCGGGLLSEDFARSGALVTGVDVRSGAIETAREHAVRVGLSIDYHVGSLEDLQLPEGSFDVVVTSFVLEHVSDLGKAISNVARVLKPGGLYLYSGINRTFTSLLIISIGFQYVLRKIPPGTLNWSQFRRPSELHAALGESGMSNVETKGLGRRQPYSVMLWNKLTGKPVEGFSVTPEMGILYVGQARRRKG